MSWGERCLLGINPCDKEKEAGRGSQGAGQNQETQPTQKESLEQIPPIRVPQSMGTVGALSSVSLRKGIASGSFPPQLSLPRRADSWRSSAGRTPAAGVHLPVCPIVSQAQEKPWMAPHQGRTQPSIYARPSWSMASGLSCWKPAPAPSAPLTLLHPCIISSSVG